MGRASGSNASRVAPSNTIAAPGGGEGNEDAAESHGGSRRTPLGSSGPAIAARSGGTAGAQPLCRALDTITTTDAVPKFSWCSMRFKKKHHMQLFMMQELEEQCNRAISTRCTGPIPIYSIVLMVLALCEVAIVAPLGVTTYRQAIIFAVCDSAKSTRGWLVESARRRWTPSKGLAGLGNAATAFEVVFACLACAACAVLVFDTPVQGNAFYARIFPYVAGLSYAVISPLLSPAVMKSPQGVLVPMISWAVQTSFLVVRAVMVEDADVIVKMAVLLVCATIFTPLLLLKMNYDSLFAFRSKFALKIENAKSSQAARLANSHTRAVKRWAAQIAHDFGTPLQSLQILSDKLSSNWCACSGGAGVQPLQQSAIDSDRVDDAEVLRSCCWSLFQLREMMLDDAKVQVGQPLQARQKTMYLPDTINMISAMMEGKIEASDLVLQPTTVMPTREPVLAMVTDPIWYTSMLLNFISNACKHAVQQVHMRLTVVHRAGQSFEPQSPNLQRSMSSRQQADDTNVPTTAFLRSEVHDDGKGVSDELAERLFHEMFVRGQERDEGTGVGLCTVQAQCTALGGRCGLGTSDILGGAVFWFEIPFRPDDTHTSSSNVKGRGSNTAMERLTEVATSAAVSLSPILIVDDDVVIRTTLSNTLKRIGFTTETASNGAKGLAKMVQKEYAMVLSDVQMPRMDGYSMLESMREWEKGQGDGGGSGVQRCQRNGRRQPLIFMSANFTAANRVEINQLETSSDAQQCGWLAKPVAAFDVLTAIMRHARTPPTTVEGGEREIKYALTRTATTTASPSVPVASSLSAAATEGTSNDEKGEGRRGGASIRPPPAGLLTLDVKGCQQKLQEMYGDAYAPLLREVPDMIPELSSDVETLLAAPTAKQAHKLKGSYRTVRTTSGRMGRNREAPPTHTPPPHTFLLY